MKVVALIFLLVSACATTPSQQPKNVLDYFYTQQNQKKSDARVVAIRRSLDPAIFASCPWLPSDSEYLRRTAFNCGWIPAIYLAASRVLSEPDIATNGKKVIYQNRFRWIDLPAECL